MAESSEIMPQDVSFDFEALVEECDSSGTVSKTMATIHKNFNSVVSEFKGDKAAERFLFEYDKLYDHLKGSHREIKAWKLRCAGLAEEVKLNSDKLNLAIHVSQEDKALISSLNKQVFDAWSMVDDLHERERKAKDTVARMTDEIHVLTTMVEDGIGLEELQKLSSKSADEKRGLDEQVKMLKHELESYETRYLEMHERGKKKIVELEEKMEGLRKKNQDLILKADGDKNAQEDLLNKIYQYERLKAKMVGVKLRLEADLDAYMAKLKNEEKRIAAFIVEREHYKKIVADDKDRISDVQKDYEDLSKKFREQQNKFNSLKHSHEEELQRIQMLNHEIKGRDKEIFKKDAEIAGFKKRLSALERDKSKLQESFKECGNSVRVQQAETQVLETNLSKAYKILYELNGMMTKTVRNYENSEEKRLRGNVAMTRLTGELKMKEEENQRLMKDLAHLNKWIQDCFDKLKNCIKEKDRIVMDMNAKQTKIVDLQTNILNLKMENSKLEKENMFMEAENKEANRKVVQAIDDKNAIASTLAKTELENSDYKNANANFLKQMKSLHIEILNKEKQNSNLTDKMEKLRHQYDNLCNELIHCNNEGEKLKSLLFQTELQLKNATNMIERQDMVISDKNIRIKQLTSHRNILGATCVKNNEKIDMLLTKHDLLQAILNNGNRLYEERVKEIKLLHLQNTNTWRQKDIVMRKLQQIDNLKSKLSLANMELVKSKAHLKALEEQPENHVHTWMTIKAKDPSKYELLMKSIHLVKKLIIKTDEVANLETALTEKAYILTNLKNLLSRSAGPEVPLKAAINRIAKNKAEKKLKAAIAEMNMLEWKAEERKAESDDLKKELVEEKEKRLKTIQGYNRKIDNLKEKMEEKKETSKICLPPIHQQKDQQKRVRSSIINL